jgi:Protein of unknown function (DUF2934)
MLLRLRRCLRSALELMNRAAEQRIDGDDMAQLSIKSIGGETLAADVRETAPAAAQTSVFAIPENAIARRAYELWLDRGCPEGSPEEDWYQAVSELTPAGQTMPAAPQRPVAENVAADSGGSNRSPEGGRSTASMRRSPAADLLRHA